MLVARKSFKNTELNMKTLFFLVQVVWQVYLTKSQEWIFPQQLSGHNYYPQQYTYQGPNRMYPNQFQSVVPDRAKMESSSERISVTSKCKVRFRKLAYSTVLCL